jgi:hypothetical protein
MTLDINDNKINLEQEKAIFEILVLAGLCICIGTSSVVDYCAFESERSGF